MSADAYDIEGLRESAARDWAAAGQPGVVARGIDWLAGVVSPGWQQDRLSTRHSMAAAAYDAAEISRLTRDWMTDTLSGDQQVLPEMHGLNARARHGYDNSWAIRGVTESFRRDIGCPLPRLVACDPDAARRDGKLAALNREVNFLFDEWSADPDLCDLAGRLPLPEQVGLMVAEWVQVGQGFWVEGVLPAGRRAEAMPALTLQQLEVEQLASDILFDSPGKNEIKNGLECDEFGRVVAYWFYLGDHPLESANFQPTRVPAARVKHFMRPTRVRQALAPSRLTPVLVADRELQSYLKSEARSKRLEACIAWQMVRDKGATTAGVGQVGLPATGAAGLRDSTGRPVNAMQSGVVLDNAPGTELKLMDPSRPGNTFDMYVKRMETQIAAGADRSRSTVAREFMASYTAENRGLIEDRKTNHALQDLLVSQALRGVHRTFVSMCLTTPGVLSDEAMAEARTLLGNARRRRYLFKTLWQRPEEEPLDQAKTAAANKINIDYRLGSRSEITGRRRRTVEDVFDDIGDERKLAEKQGFKLPEDAAIKTSAKEPRPRGASNAPDGAGERGSDGDTEAQRWDSVDALVDTEIEKAVSLA